MACHSTCAPDLLPIILSLPTKKIWRVYSSFWKRKKRGPFWKRKPKKSVVEAAARYCCAHHGGKEAAMTSRSAATSLPTGGGASIREQQSFADGQGLHIQREKNWKWQQSPLWRSRKRRQRKKLSIVCVSDTTKTSTVIVFQVQFQDFASCLLACLAADQKKKKKKVQPSHKRTIFPSTSPLQWRTWKLRLYFGGSSSA